MVSVVISTPMPIGRQWPASATKISRQPGRCARSANARVSGSERRSVSSTGTIRQPTPSGMRQPQAVIAAGERRLASAIPIAAASTTATCWLADCQDV